MLDDLVASERVHSQETNEFPTFFIFLIFFHCEVNKIFRGFFLLLYLWRKQDLWLILPSYPHFFYFDWQRERERESGVWCLHTLIRPPITHIYVAWEKRKKKKETEWIFFLLLLSMMKTSQNFMWESQSLNMTEKHLPIWQFWPSLSPSRLPPFPATFFKCPPNPSPYFSLSQGCLQVLSQSNPHLVKPYTCTTSAHIRRHLEADVHSWEN